MYLQDPRWPSGGHPRLLQNSSQPGHWANSKWSPRPSRAQKADHDNLQESQQVKSDCWITATFCSTLSLLFVTFAGASVLRQWDLPHSAGPGDLPQVPGPATWTRDGSWSKTCESHSWHLTRWDKLEKKKIHLNVLVLFLSIFFLLCLDVFWLGEPVFTPQAGASDKTALLNRGQGFYLFSFSLSMLRLCRLLLIAFFCLFSGQELHFWIPWTGRWSQEISHTNSHVWGNSLNKSPPHQGRHLGIGLSLTSY